MVEGTKPSSTTRKLLKIYRQMEEECHHDVGVIYFLMRVGRRMEKVWV